jgi:hypothetical protein
MTLLVATLLLFLSGPFVLWPLIRTPDETQSGDDLVRSSN